VLVPIANVDPDDGVQVTGTFAPYSSLAVGAVQDSVAPDALVAVAIMLEGIPAIVGGVVPALILTVNDSAAVPP